VRLGPPPPTESYLRIDAVGDAALATGAEAVHPGYGFLAERAAFARAVEDAGLVYVGPAPATIEALGDKLNARRLAASVGVPAVPGTLEPAPVDRPDQVAEIVATAERIGFPLLVKAAAGGGGRGMRRVASAEDLPAALASGSHEAASAFGDGSVYLEREILPARHVEVQLLADAHGRVVALGERDCSLQRRHQKLVEEAPAPGLSRTQRVELHAMAVRLGEAAGLRNAATCEFLLDPDGRSWFLEVNTRLQVEHGVTELVAGVDIVREQFRIAAGEPLSAGVAGAGERAADPAGHAIEVRIAAEDPSRAFAPTPGRVGRWTMPSGPGIRVDTAIEAGDRVPPDYDNLIAKLMVHAPDRDAAIDALRRALDETEIGGVQTTLPFHRFVARSGSFRRRPVDGLGRRALGRRGGAPGGRRPRAPRRRARRGRRVGRDAGDAAHRPDRDHRRAPGLRRVAPRGPAAGDRPMARLTSRPPSDAGDTDGRGPGAARPDATPVDPAGSGAAASQPPNTPTPDGAVRVRLAPPSRTGSERDRTVAVLAQRQALVDGRPVDAALRDLGRGRHVLETESGRVPVVLEDPRRTAGGSRVREVLVAGFRFEVEIEPERRAALRERAIRGRSTAGTGGPLEVRAVIPGIVLSVSVAAGDRVAAGQQLLVVEAMKMQNELRAPGDGTIERVGVAEGVKIEIGDLLVVIGQEGTG
jgi:acetyl/propionyl-CoA carboxylase alpha subunit